MSAAAYLRVYIPDEQVPGEPPVRPVRRGWPAPVLTRGQFGVYYESSRDDAFVADVDGRRYVCPRTPRLRMLEGLIAFRRSYGDPAGSMLVPEPVADRAARELDHLHARHPGARSHILTAPFFVPLRWFAAFRPEEREVVQRPDGLTVRYRTFVSSAVTRLERAAEVLTDAGFDEEMLEQVRDVARWLEQFAGESLVELDYGGTSTLFSDGELAIDESAAEIHASLDALAEGDLEAAGEHYERVASRWARGQALTYAN